MPPAPRSLQELPPHWAHFCLGLERFAAWRLGRDFRHLSLVVGFSAGADSSALLQALVCLADRGDLRLTAVHLDHGLRPESADDAAFAARACAELGVELAAERVDVAEIARRDGLGLEDAGRRERYALFERVRAARGADLVCTAHQLNDLAEDVLLRLARGTAWPGLGGMPAWDPARRLLRPLLLTPKAELVQFLTELGRPWVEDASNQDPAAARNRMRHDLLPRFLAENPNFLHGVARLWEVARADDEYWSGRVAELAPATAGVAVSIPLPALLEMPRAERLRLCKTLLDRLGAGQALGDTLFRLDEALTQGRKGVVFQFPGHKTVRIGTRNLHFEPDPDAGERSGPSA